MVTKIFKGATAICLGLILITSLLFAEGIKTNAVELDMVSQNNADDHLQISTSPYPSNEESDNQDKKSNPGQTNIDDLIGEEQIFPFNP